MGTGTLGRPEDAEGREQQADCELDRVLGHARERRAHQGPDDHDDDERGSRRRRGEPELPLGAAEADDDERDLEPFEQDALERNRERVPVEPGPLVVRRGGSISPLREEDLFLVVQRLVAARSQDRLAQPLQPEAEQERAHHELEHLDGQELQRGTERGHDGGERDRRRGDPDERRAPAARDADREDDREGLDHLDRARQEGAEEDEGGAHLGSLALNACVDAPGRAASSATVEAG